MTEELIDNSARSRDFGCPRNGLVLFQKANFGRVRMEPRKSPSPNCQKLAAAYVLDGSVRKSGARLRVDARLIRADNGYVVWSETYDRPFDDILMVQDDISSEVAKSAEASIEAAPEHSRDTSESCAAGSRQN